MNLFAGGIDERKRKIELLPMNPRFAVLEELIFVRVLNLGNAPGLCY